MVQDNRKFSKRQNVFMKGAFQVILGAIAGLGVFLVIAVLVSDPEASYAERLQGTSCNLINDCSEFQPETVVVPDVKVESAK